MQKMGWKEGQVWRPLIAVGMAVGHPVLFTPGLEALPLSAHGAPARALTCSIAC